MQWHSYIQYTSQKRKDTTQKVQYIRWKAKKEEKKRKKQGSWLFLYTI